MKITNNNLKNGLAVLCLAVLLFALSFSSLMKYLNSPVYDFAISALPQPDSSPQVALINSNDFSNLRGQNLTAFHQALQSLEPKGVLFLSYPGEGNEALSKLADPKANYYFGQASSVGVDRNVVEHPIPDWAKAALPVSPILLPAPDVDGIIRSFDSARYRRLGLQCLECKIASPDNSEPDFLIRYRLNTSSLPMVNANDLIHGTLPGGVLEQKFLIVANELTQSNGVYSVATNHSQRISFPYYLGSVLDNLFHDQKTYRLNSWLLLLVLAGLGILISLTLRFFSNKQALVIFGLTVPCWVLINLASLHWTNTFIPLVEPVLMALGLALITLFRRENKDSAILRKTSHNLELSLGDTASFQKVSKTDLCASLINLFGRVIEVKSLRLYTFGALNSVKQAISYNDGSTDHGAYEFSYEQLGEFSEPVPFLLSGPAATDDASETTWVGVPISRGKQRLGIIVMESGSAEIDSLTTIYRHYRDEIFDEIVSWQSQAQQGAASKLKLNKLFHQSLSQQQAMLVNQLLDKHRSLKQNYNALVSTALAYNIYGDLVSLNSAAEQFAKRANIVWYNRPLADVLQDLTDWSTAEVKDAISSVLLEKKPRMFTVHAGSNGDYLATLSIETQDTEDQSQKQVEKTFLTLEIGNVSKISHASRLKHTFVTDLTDQVKHDLNRAITLIEKQSFLEGDSERYDDLLTVLDTLGGRLKSSKTYIDDLASIDNKEVYPVDVANITQAVLTELETKFSEKGVNLVFNRPAFLSLVALDYRELGFVLSYLIGLLLKDSVKNSQLEVSVEEKDAGSGRFIALSILSQGYGLPQELLNSRQNQTNVDELTEALERCKNFSHSNGGHFDISSRAGEGIRVGIELPIVRELH